MKSIPFAELSESDQTEAKSLLSSLSIFRIEGGRVRGFLSEAQMKVIVELVEVTDMQFRDVVQTIGKPVYSLYCVMEGSLAKFQSERSGNNAEIVEYINKGGQIGQLHMICGSDKASSTVLVESDTARCASIKRSELDNLLREDPVLLRAICNNLALSLRDHVRRSTSNRLVRLVDHLQASCPEEFEKKESGTAIPFIAAAISGIASMSCGYPLDVVRTRLQTEGRGDMIYGFQVLFKLLTEEGFSAAYRGWSSHAVSHTVQNTTYHTAYAKLVAFFKSPTQQLSDPVRLLLGVLAGCFAAFVVTPLSTVTFRMQGQGGAGKGIFSVLSEIINSDGFLSLWHGLGPSLILAVNPCITFYVFDELKAVVIRRKNANKDQKELQSKLTPYETLAIGATAKAVASALTFPILMAKIRMGLFGKEKYPSTLVTFSTVCIALSD